VALSAAGHGFKSRQDFNKTPRLILLQFAKATRSNIEVKLQANGNALQQAA
jgi:hypothetical protein